MQKRRKAHLTVRSLSDRRLVRAEKDWQSSIFSMPTCLAATI